MLTTKLSLMKHLIYSSRIEKRFPDMGCNHCPQSTNPGPTHKDVSVAYSTKKKVSRITAQLWQYLSEHHDHKWTQKDKNIAMPPKRKWLIHHPPSSFEKITPNFVIFYFSSEINVRNLTQISEGYDVFKNKTAVTLHLSQTTAWILTWKVLVVDAQPLQRCGGPRVYFPAHNMAPGSTPVWSNRWTSDHKISSTNSL